MYGLISEILISIMPCVMVIVISYHTVSYSNKIEYFKEQQNEMIELYEKRVPYNQIRTLGYNAADIFNEEKLIFPSFEASCTLECKDLEVWSIIYYKGYCDKTVFIDINIQKERDWIYN